MDSHERALLEALRDDPDALGPLKALAEIYRDDPRGPHIQLHIDMLQAPDQAARYDLYTRIRATEAAAKAAWQPAWLVPKAHGWLDFRNGVPTTLRIYAHAAAEVLRDVHLDDLPSLRTLSVLPYERLTVATATTLAAQPALRRFQVFSYGNTRAPSEAFAVLLASPHLGRLHTLHITTEPNLDDHALRILAENPSITALECASLSLTGLSDTACHALVASHARPTLTEVRISNTGATGRGVAALVRLPRLRVLEASGLDLAPEALDACGRCPTLTRLGLHNLRLSAPRGRALLRGDFPALHTLDLSKDLYHGHRLAQDAEHATWHDRLRERWPEHTR